MSGSDMGVQKIENILLDDLLLDPQNPRLPNAIEDESDIADWLVKNADVGELMSSIGSQGYFGGEPILITPEGAPAGKYYVVEGNCRVTACKLLQSTDLLSKQRPSISASQAEATHKPSALPCVSYDTRNEVLGYLGYRHVTGVHSWDALQKARYLKQLREMMIDQGVDAGELLSQLAKEVGSRRDYVAKLLTGVALYDKIVENDFFDLPKLDENDISFSLLTTALSYKDICTFIGLEGPADEAAESLDMANLENLTDWMFRRTGENRTRLGESRNLKALAAVVSHHESLSHFKDGMPLDEAVEWTSLPDELYRSAIDLVISSLRRGSSSMHNVKKITESDIENLKEINSLTKSLHTLAKAKLSESEEFEDL